LTVQSDGEAYIVQASGEGRQGLQGLRRFAPEIVGAEVDIGPRAQGVIDACAEIQVLRMAAKFLIVAVARAQRSEQIAGDVMRVIGLATPGGGGGRADIKS